MVSVRCDACGSRLERKPSKAEMNEYNFCDKSCAGTFYSDSYSEADEYETAIKKLYWDDKMSVRQVADELGKGKSTIDKYMRELNIPRRGRTEALGDGVGMYTEKRGYEILYGRVGQRNRTVRVHSLVAIANGTDPSEIFGGIEGKIVHHRNGIPWDNRPSNLETMSQSEHAELHQNEGAGA